MTSKFSRRHALEALSLGARRRCRPCCAARAQAQGGRVVVGTWGGDYSRLLAKNIDTPLLVPKNYEVVHDIGGDSQRRAKMRAEKRLPRGTSDMQGLSAAQMFEMNEAGVCRDRSTTRRSRTRKNLLPQMKYPYGVGHIYSGKVILYNPKLITDAADELRRRVRSEARQQDRHHRHPVSVHDDGGGARGGRLDDQLRARQGAADGVPEGGRARSYPTNEAMAQALQNEEIGIGIMWKARAVQWQKAGVKVRDGRAEGGRSAVRLGLRDSEERAEQGRRARLLNEMLEKSAQESFADDMGYNGDRHQREGRARPEKRIGFTPTSEKRLIDLDYGYLAKNDAALKEWWDKMFKA